VRAGPLAAASLGLSGVGMALLPRQSAKALALSPDSGRGLTELRAGLGGTFAGLGLWALARGSKDGYAAVGMTCLGAAAFRAYSLKVDDPEPDPGFWALLAGEVALGVAGLLARPREEVR
jgi:hypothetical protein